jgi:hypothetical protein
MRRGLRRTPSQIADRRRGKGYAFEDTNIVTRRGGARDQTCIDLDGFQAGCGKDRAAGQNQE